MPKLQHGADLEQHAARGNNVFSKHSKNLLEAHLVCICCLQARLMNATLSILLQVQLVKTCSILEMKSESQEMSICYHSPTGFRRCT